MKWKEILGVFACMLFLSGIALFGFDYLEEIQELKKNRYKAISKELKIPESKIEIEKERDREEKDYYEAITQDGEYSILFKKDADSIVAIHKKEKTNRNL
ncbi:MULTISPECIES: hypothetical protein [Bacillus]|uniref:Uncharacterized protein n=2 Tax=Bacillus thuringiensis TaxID=1428 RepID=A0AAP4Q6G7_BACTU|nr:MULTISPECIES: hypothetical protein [Bacillus]MEC0046425.1 hypothetical protein [Bacillus cereus]AFV21790.1 NADH dehydrogenase subunit 6 [Bacillus thuringiensis Bt407]EEM25183.1 NADH dehydrogenase subunit 6 [Bacillus thuringiensis Bt407]ERI01033.1 hypothetical protein BTCBT_002588 [Bacillus thuringiensis T01-328]MBN6707795.1 hypothetical protein [Bacillus thuringiensis]